MAKTSTYSMLNVAVTLDGLDVRGFWEGDDAISIERGGDIGTGLVGADGASIFSQSADRSARITLRLQHTSPTHRQLLQKAEQQYAGRMIGFPLDVKEKQSGEGGSTDQAFIQTAATDTKGKNAGVREWVIWTGDWKPEIPNP